MSERIVAIALLTRPELKGLGKAFDRAWPIQDAPSTFDALLRAIDQADQKFQEGELDLG